MKSSKTANPVNKISKMMIKAIVKMFKTTATHSCNPKNFNESFTSFAAKIKADSNTIMKKYKDDYSDELILPLANICELLSSASEQYEENRASINNTSILALAELVHGSMALSQQLVSIVESIKHSDENFDSQPSTQTLYQEFGEVAHEIHYSAQMLGDTAGFNTGIEAFNWPRFMACGCHGKALKRSPLEKEVNRPINHQHFEIDEEEVDRAYRELIIALLKLSILMKLLEGFFSGMLAYFDEYYYQACSQDCTGPSGSIIAIARTRSYSSQDGTSTPMADADVTLCCSNSCLVVLTEWDVEVVPVTGVKVGPAMGVGREVPAAAVAGRKPALVALIKAIKATPPACP